MDKVKQALEWAEKAIPMINPQAQVRDRDYLKILAAEVKRLTLIANAVRTPEEWFVYLEKKAECEEAIDRAEAAEAEVKRLTEELESAHAVLIDSGNLAQSLQDERDELRKWKQGLLEVMLRKDSDIHYLRTKLAAAEGVLERISGGGYVHRDDMFYAAIAYFMRFPNERGK